MADPRDESARGLTLRYREADDGLRPIPERTTFWNSPDLWIDHGGDTSVSVMSGDAREGAVNVITARVSNMSPDITYRDINVEVWICPFGMGEAGPHVQLPSAGNLPRTGFGPGPLAPGESIEIPCEPPWTAEGAGGLVSLAANCWADDPPEGAPVTAKLDFRGNAHHARRNVAVLPIALSLDALDFHDGGFGGRFLAANPSPGQAQDVVLRVVPVNPRDFSAGDTQMLLPHTPPEIVYRPIPFEESLHLELTDGAQTGNEIAIRLDPTEQRRISITTLFKEVLPNAGSVYLADIIQQSAEDEITGGFRLLLPIIP